LVVVLSAAPLPADVLSTVHVCPSHQCAIVDYFVAIHRPLLPTIASHCLVALLPSITKIVRILYPKKDLSTQLIDVMSFGRKGLSKNPTAREQL
jgi:hypothetical protein